MRRFVEGTDRVQSTLFPECLEDWIGEDNPVRGIDGFVDGLGLAGLGFNVAEPGVPGRPSYRPSVLLKLYIYGYLNRVQSSRRLEREAGRNVEVMWLTGRLAPDHKTIAAFRKDNGRPLRAPWRTRQRGHRRQQAQGGNQPRQELHARQDGAAHGADRGECRALSAAARYRRPAGAVRGAKDQAEPPEREDRGAEGADAAARDSQGANACRTGPADIADRSRCPLDGDQRPRLRGRWLQRSGCRRHRTSSDRHA